MSENPPQRVCGCAICDLALDFELDAHLLAEVENWNCVIFAGAGISTETGQTHPDTLYDTLRHAAGVDDKPEFWEVVDNLESRPNGRQKLLEIVKDRFSYINSFRDLRRQATRFHSSLRNAPYFRAVITTNWDRYFEDVIEATPFVYDSDIPFWESARRPVIKIHGSIDNYSSLVASSQDYSACERRLREGALGAVVKQIFATRTIVFCGYSARDSDFRRIFQTIRGGLGPFARTNYLISPFVSDEESKSLMDELGIVSIRTDATHFVETVKAHMSQKFCLLRDDAIDLILEEYIRFSQFHLEFVESFETTKLPHLIFATSYQDGVIHAYERILDRWKAGEFSDLHAVQARISAYQAKIDSYRKARNYWDVAYFTGYRNGLIQLLLLHDDEIEELPPMPECYHPGKGELTLEQFDAQVRPNPEVHKAALKEAKKRVSRLAGEGLVVQHLPWG